MSMLPQLKIEKKGKKSSKSHLLEMTTVIVGHVFFPDSFFAMVLTFVGGRLTLFLQRLVNGSRTRSAQVGLV